MAGLEGKTLFITGASRGIGLAIALRAARDGANIAIAAKTHGPTRSCRAPFDTAAEEIEAAGGNALRCRATSATRTQVAARRRGDRRRVRRHRHLVNNASAISLTRHARQTTMKRYDLMHEVNARGTFLFSKPCCRT